MVNDELIKNSFEISQNEVALITIVYKEGFSEPEENKRQAGLVQSKVVEIVNQDPDKKHDLLLDIINLGGLNYISSEAREIYGDMAKLPQLGKAAVVGNNTFLEVVINLLMKTAGKDESFKWCKSRDEALEWLKS